MIPPNVAAAFRRNYDGSWTTIGSVTINANGGQIGIGPGMTFSRGIAFMGIDLAAWLDANHPAARFPFYS